MKHGAKAQLFTLDLLLALIPLTIALGISANAMSGVGTQLTDYTNWYSTNRMMNDAMDVLIKTPGEPGSWNSTNPPDILGLANYSEAAGVGPYFLDDKKVGALNASDGGGTVFSVGITRLMGNETFSYMNLSFLGATLNTTNLSITYATGSRSNALNIYGGERLGILAITNIEGVVEEVGHFQTNATPCCTLPGKREYNTSFFVISGDLTTFDYWLYGEWRSGAVVTNKYQVEPAGSVGCDCAVPNPSINLDNLNSGDPLFKVQIDAQLTENSMNQFIVRPEGNGEANYYMIKAPAGTPEDLISPNLAGAKPVKVILEVGR